MNLSYFISRRISREQKVGFASAIHKIAIASIAIGLSASMISFLVMLGFQKTVKEKVYSFSGHLMVTKFSMNNSPEEAGMNYHIKIFDHPEEYPFIRHVQEYAHKIGLVKTETDEVLGVVVKGVGKSYDVRSFETNMREGKFLELPDSGYSSQVVLSRIISDKLNAKVGDNIIVHFFQDPPRFRKLKVSGIYETNLSEYFDGKVVLADIRMIQKLNDWSDSLAGGVEVYLVHDDNVDQAGLRIAETMDFDLDVERISDKFSQVFEWLNLLSRQVNILLAIILIVVCVNMISIVLILVMERTQMIGMLKAFGANNSVVRSIFIFNGINLIAKGLFLGNVIGLGLAFVQYHWKVIKLNPHDYYMNFVPISWSWDVVLILNLLTFGVVTFVLIIPTMIIARINPIKAIRFD
ncbi:MAG: FtsX-like permease family protein [Chryseolinea sp.]